MTTTENDSSLLAAWIIGPYLVALTLFFVGLSAIMWLASDWGEFFEFMPLPKAPQECLDPKKFALFQQMVISACAAGLGGVMFMIREFYIKYSYGRKDKTNLFMRREYLKLKEIPRYILLPLSSPILGPISFVLAKAGSITFAGLSPGSMIPTPTLILLGFVFGLAYHDALDRITKLIEDFFKKKG